MSTVTQQAPRFTVRRVLWDEGRESLVAVRQEVFVVEQRVPPELEWYEGDEECEHVLAVAADGRPIGTGRLHPRGQLGRMAVDEGWRRRGVGSALLLELVAMAREAGLEEVVAHAQVAALGFYEAHGFVAEGEVFLDAAILHRVVRLRLAGDRP